MLFLRKSCFTQIKLRCLTKVMAYAILMFWRKERIILLGDVPNPINPPSGCPFHPRCSMSQDRCKIEVPHLINYSKDSNEHLAACHIINQT